MQEKSIRWIVDDALKFVKREARRQSYYDAIVLDPPKFGRGPNGEVWKLENELYGLVELCAEALSEQPAFMLINGYTTGFAASVLGNVAQRCMRGRGTVMAEELALPVTSGGVLPCGATARWTDDV